MKKLYKIILRIIFWDFPRGSWQYDLFCIILIFATIFIKPNFLLPKKNFKDKPKKAVTIYIMNKDSALLFSEKVERAENFKSISNP